VTARPFAANHLVVVAAGTGGHVTPGLAVAARLQARGWSVSWLGTRSGMERALVERAGIDFDPLDFGSLRGRGWAMLASSPFRLLRAVWQARGVLRRRAPTAVFATGGYVAVPAGWAARLARVPLALLNADAAPLLSMRLLDGAPRVVLCGFDGAAARRAGSRALVSGNPVREAIAAVAPPGERFAGRAGPLRLLVLGGSLGATALNRVVPEALKRLAARDPAAARPQVVHQCGAAHLDEARRAYAAAGLEAEVVSFIDDVAARYAWADVAICRAGAITTSELAAAGVASILVPFVASTTDHQRSNAEFLAARGAAVHLPQPEADAQRLAALLGGLDRPRLLQMAQAARELGRTDATAIAAAAIEKMAARPSGAAATGPA